MKRIEFTYRLFYAILTMISVWFATAGFVKSVSGAELGWNMGYVEERVTKAETKITAHDKEIAALKLQVAKLEKELKKAKEPIIVSKPKETKAVQAKSYQAKIPTPATSRGYVQRLASNRWTYPGRIEDHIREHGIDPSGWSRSELEQIHANIHENYGSGIVGGSRSVSSSSTPTYRVISRPQVYWSSAPSYGSSCPGGVCPTYR